MDALERGQHLTGERDPKSVLSNADVKAIRAELASGAQGRVLAMKFGVTESHISHIKTGRSRKHG